MDLHESLEMLSHDLELYHYRRIEYDPADKFASFDLLIHPSTPVGSTALSAPVAPCPRRD
jgi:hypothetical protein